MRSRLLALALGLFSPWQAASAYRTEPNSLTRISLQQLRATEGTLQPGARGRWLVDVPKMRAVVPGASSPVAELRFTYLGPTEQQQALASGEMRRQVGLKLRAQDGCNVVYVMWRLAPKPGLVVSVKANPGVHTSAACGNRGYTTVRPRQHSPVPALSPGVPHALRAELEGQTLHVHVDDALAWEGVLPPEALAFDGPVGLRTDNGCFELELFTRMP
jgi:hypothetical protein